jgi:S-adenosyl-L-methionine hydrolase (adenosine-forming)
MALVTLTTDFGMRDPYVAAMKGVIEASCPGVQILDLSHEIAPQDVVEGALFLASATPFFPAGAIHVAVVDPGVGTARRPIAALTRSQTYVCPDNGLLTLVARNDPILEVRVINNPVFMRGHVSSTFHGRDVFAPAAARLASGRPYEDVGEVVDHIVTLDVPAPQWDPEGVMTAEVVHVDRFGNLLTNVSRSHLEGRHVAWVQAASCCIEGLSQTYSDVPRHAPLTLFGSFDYLELAVNQGNASEVLSIGVGDPVEIHCQ